jgi:hypothetical protein
MSRLFIPCIIISLITYKQILITKNKIDLKILKLLFLLQKILFICNFFKEKKLFGNIHKLYSNIIILSSLLLNEKHNILFVLSILLISIFTKEFYNECLLNIDNNYVIYLSIYSCLHKLYKI